MLFYMFNGSLNNKHVIVLLKNGSKQCKKNAIEGLIQSSLQKGAWVSHAFVDFLAYIV